MDIHVSLFFPAVFLLVFAAGMLNGYLAAFFSIVLHEAGHVAFAAISGSRLRTLRITSVGLCAEIDEGVCSIRERLILYSCGPAANFLIAAAAALICLLTSNPSPLVRLILLTNLYLALFNLLPAVPLDGGRILRELLAERVGILAAGKWVHRLAFMLSIIFVLLGMVQFVSGWYNLSLLVIGLYIAFTLKTGKMEAALMNIKQIIYRRSRLEKKGIYPARDLVAMKWTQIGDTIRNMDFDRFHFVHVVDENFKLIRIFTENEVIESLLKHNADMTFEELIRLADSDQLADTDLSGSGLKDQDLMDGESPDSNR